MADFKLPNRGGREVCKVATKASRVTMAQMESLVQFYRLDWDRLCCDYKKIKKYKNMFYPGVVRYGWGCLSGPVPRHPFSLRDQPHGI